MRLFLLFSLIFIFTSQTYAQAPAWKWAKSASGDGDDQATSIATDTFGDAYIAGFFTSDSIVLGSTVLKNALPENEDIFLAKYDAEGNLLWARQAGNEMNDRINSMTVDKDNNLYVTGYFYSQTIVFGEDTLRNAGNVGDIFIVKYSPEGKVIWARRDGGTGLEIPHAICSDGASNIIVAGRFSSLSMTIGNTTLVQSGSMDVFVSKYDSAGHVLWAKGAGGGSNDEANSVSTDASDNIYISGYFNQKATFGDFTLNTLGSADVFVASLDASGTVLWAKSAGGNGDDRSTGISTDEAGNSYITGYFASPTLQIGTSALTNVGGNNSFVAKFDNDGNVVWVKSVNGTTKALSIVQQNGHIYVCGLFSSGILHFAATDIGVHGHGDLLLLAYDREGNEQWLTMQDSGGESNETANSIAVDQQGNIFIAGFFDSDPLVFGPSVLSNTRTGFDLFLAVLSSETSGAKRLERTTDIQVYPNPAGEYFFVKTPKDQPGNCEFRLYDITGSLRFSKTVDSSEYHNGQVKLSPFLPEGVYMLQVRLNQAFAGTSKIIIR